MALRIKDLARLAGVSTATVSLVLSDKDQGRVSARRRTQILELARKHGYRSNLAARGLAEGRTYRIAICVEGPLAGHAIIGNFSRYERLGLLSSGIQAAGYSIEILQVDTERPISKISRDLSTTAADAFVFLTWHLPSVDKLLLSLKEKGIPALASGTWLRDEAFTWTDIDRPASFDKAVRYLVRQGHRSIAFLDTAPGGYSSVKTKAFVDAARRELGTDAEQWVFRATRLSFEDALGITEQAVDHMKEVTAFILSDNFYAEAVMHALRGRGIEPGRDCRIVGFGDTVLADRCSPKLSHYSLRIKDQVSFGLEALTDELANPSKYVPRHKLFGPRFIRRQT